MTKTKSPNIVFIVLDTHRYDRISTYGYQRDTTPSLDDFGRQSTVFESGISTAQWTIPSHAAMFTGEYPTTHQTLQAHHKLDSRIKTIASHLRKNGYDTTGFCNNPLVGVLDNGLKQGFDTFYNYGGAVPSRPKSSSKLPRPIDQAWEWYTQMWRKLSYPVQNAFAHSDFLFQLSLNPMMVPLWSKLANFKGDTVQSLRDTLSHLKEIHRDKEAAPHFTFVNLMETHLPYSLPDKFVQKYAPYFKEDREVRDFMRNYNSQAFRWLLPLEERFKPMESAILNDMYDAEVSYQDSLLEPVLEFLCRDEVAENTLTVIAGDHGEGMGEHDFMGHSFVAYQELVHVPLMVKFPGDAASGKRVKTPVSTRRIFHTALDAANIQVHETENQPASDVKQLNLLRTAQGHDPEHELVFVEAYPPNTFLSMMESHTPQLIDSFYCRTNRRAVVHGDNKLVRIDGVKDELFNLSKDPQELDDLIDTETKSAGKLASKLDTFMAHAIARRPDSWQTNHSLDIAEDENLMNQLRALGYIE